MPTTVWLSPFRGVTLVPDIQQGESQVVNQQVNPSGSRHVGSYSVQNDAPSGHQDVHEDVNASEEDVKR